MPPKNMRRLRAVVMRANAARASGRQQEQGWTAPDGGTSQVSQRPGLRRQNEGDDGMSFPWAAG